MVVNVGPVVPVLVTRHPSASSGVVLLLRKFVEFDDCQVPPLSLKNESPVLLMPNTMLLLRWKSTLLAFW